jgi:hypothetical protein
VFGVFLIVLSLLQAGSFEGPPFCIPLQEYMRTMGEFPLEDVALYETVNQELAGRLERLDLTIDPPEIRLQQDTGIGADQLCLLRSDLERMIAYRVDILRHDMDGTGCVSFDEGSAHSAEFQKVSHNRGVEVRIYPYRLHGDEWRRVSAQSGFAHEVFLFDCGVKVGPPKVLEMLEELRPHAGQQLVREDSPLASRPDFIQFGFIRIGSVDYRIGTGLALPVPEF